MEEDRAGAQAMDAMAVDTPGCTPRWYTFEWRALPRSRWLRIVLTSMLGCLLLYSVSFAPLWRLNWYYPVYSASNFSAVRDSQGQRHRGGVWVRSREIRVYQLPQVRDGQAKIIAGGTRALIDELGLRFTVTVLPVPDEVLQAYRASLVKKSVNGETQLCVSFTDLQSRLLTLRGRDQRADMLVVTHPIAEAWWAHGMASFNSGLALLQQDNVSFHLGKHESGHLLGYMLHDSFPLFVFGYAGEGNPWTRDSLMMLYGNRNALSPRAHDALSAFWRGMSNRQGIRYMQE